MSLLKSIQTFLAPRDIFAPTRNFTYAQGLIAQTANWELEIDPLQNSVVAACVNAVARALPDVPLLLENRTATGWQVVTDHECLRVLRAPNEDHSDADVWGLTSGYKATHGQAFWLLLPDRLGRVGELHVWNPERVTVLGDESHFIGAYRLRREGGTSFEVDKKQVIHFRHLPDFCNPRLGWNPLRTGRAQIAGDNIGATYHTSLLHNAGVVSLLISLKEGAATGQVTPEQFQQVLTNIRRAARERSGGVEGINLPLEIHKLAYSPDEMNVDKLISYYETRICAVMGVPQRVAGLGADPTYHNLSEALNDFWERRIVPDRNSDAATLNRQWLPLFGLDDGNWRFRFDFSGVPALQENRDALHARVRADWEKGLVDKGQARSLLGYSAAGDEAYAGVFFGGKAGTQTEAPEGALSSSQIAAVKGLIEAEWDESKHPRDEIGRFSGGGGGAISRAGRPGEVHSRSHDLGSAREESHSSVNFVSGHETSEGGSHPRKPYVPPPPGPISNAHSLAKRGTPLEKHLLTLLTDEHLKDKSMLKPFASSLSAVAARIPARLHGKILATVKSIHLFDDADDLNDYGHEKYGSQKWPEDLEAVATWIWLKQELILDNVGDLKKGPDVSDEDIEWRRRRYYAHELGHTLDGRPHILETLERLRNKEGIGHHEPLLISDRPDWKKAVAKDLIDKDVVTEYALRHPKEAFAEIMAFTMVPEAFPDIPMALRSKDMQENARLYCKLNLKNCYKVLVDEGIITPPEDETDEDEIDIRFG